MSAESERPAIIGVMASVLMFGSRSGAAMPVTVVKVSMSASQQLADINDAARDRRRCNRRRRRQVRAALRPLPVLEIAIGGRDRALAWRHDVAVAGDAHRAASVAAFEARRDEHLAEPRRF